MNKMYYWRSASTLTLITLILAISCAQRKPAEPISDNTVSEETISNAIKTVKPLDYSQRNFFEEPVDK